MPCNSDYLTPTRLEVESRKTAENIKYLLTELKLEVPSLIENATGCYGDRHIADTMVSTLCKLCKGLTKDEMDKIVYGRTKEARQLADWWEEHQEADRLREEKESLKNQTLS
jgi:hypothetical protein